jgi:hypothetical protein
MRAITPGFVPRQARRCRSTSRASCSGVGASARPTSIVRLPLRLAVKPEFRKCAQRSSAKEGLLSRISTGRNALLTHSAARAITASPRTSGTGMFRRASWWDKGQRTGSDFVENTLGAWTLGVPSAVLGVSAPSTLFPNAAGRGADNRSHRRRPRRRDLHRCPHPDRGRPVLALQVRSGGTLGRPYPSTESSGIRLTSPFSSLAIFDCRQPVNPSSSNRATRSSCRQSRFARNLREHRDVQKLERDFAGIRVAARPKDERHDIALGNGTAVLSTPRGLATPLANA